MSPEKESRKRINRAIHTAREAATAAPEVREVRLGRFHAAMDALRGNEEPVEVHKMLHRAPWYLAAEKLLAR